MHDALCDFSAWCTTTFRQNGGKNYFRFEFRLQISTFCTRSPYMERIFRRLSASIRPSEFKRPTIAAFGLSNFADQATIWRFLPSCWAPNFATMLAMETLMQLWRPELELVGISSGSWYHCLPIRTCLWLWEEGCTAVVWEAACCMEVRPGL